MTTTSKIAAVPRGVRNNNPGNVRRTKDNWQGLAAEQTDTAFFQFVSAPQGIRCLARILLNYQDKRGLRTIEKIIWRWAPPSDDNPTESYVSFVCRRARIGRAHTLDLHRYEDLRPIVEAIIAFECDGYAYPEAVVDKGLVLAGVEPPPKSLQSSRTIRGAQVATAATGTGLLVETARQLEPVLPFLDQAIYYIKTFGPWAVAVIALAGIGWMVWARISDYQRGLR